MPCRKGPEAETKALKAMETRWRYLLRNPEFRADFNEHRRHYREGGACNTINRESFLEKWELYPSGILYPWSRTYIVPDLSPESIEIYESFFVGDNGDFIGQPVTADDPWDVYSSGEYGDLGPGPGLFLEIRADLRYPRDLLMSLIEQELRKAQERPRPRQRLDKVDFQLRVYDLAIQGKKFTEIARTVKRPASTVKSALRAAWPRIHGSNKPSKKMAPRMGFDPQTHMQNCPVCNKGDRLCDQSLAYVNEDHVSQREVTGYDTIR